MPVARLLSAAPVPVAVAIPTVNDPSLVACNPIVQVPALVADDGATFTDSPIICAYLDELHYFPRNREELKKHDPASYKMLENAWGRKKDEKIVSKNKSEFNIDDLTLDGLKLGLRLAEPDVHLFGRNPLMVTRRMRVLDRGHQFVEFVLIAHREL